MDDNVEKFNSWPLEPSQEAIQEALRSPNGWVYVLDKEFKGKEEVPPEYIIGAWKVDRRGLIEGPFIPNPKYKNKHLFTRPN